MGGVVPVVNLEGIKPGELTLDGPTLAKIFLGEIKTWNDPAIEKLNPSVKLPAQADRRRAPFRRLGHDLHLHRLSVEGQRRLEVARSAPTPRWNGRSASAPRATKASPTTSAQTKGSIGYVEYAYAKQNKLTITKMINKDGKTVAPTAEVLQAAAANADWEGTPGFGVILTNEPGAESWPIAGATFILMHKQPQDPAAAAEALKFFAWAYAKGDKMAEDLDYVPMPDNVVDAIKKVWAERGQGRGRQAAVLQRPIDVTIRERRRIGALSLIHSCEIHGLRGRARRGLSGLPRRLHREPSMQPAGRRDVVDVALQGGAMRVRGALSRAQGRWRGCGSATPRSAI